MEYRILGPLQVLSAGNQIHIAGLRTQRILAMLLTHSNRVVTVSRLVDAAWGEDPPSTARRQVQNRVAALRAMLMPHGTRLLTKAGGYRLAVGPDELDAEVFDHLTSSAAAGGDLGHRASALQQALALWRGPALDGLDSPVLAPTADLLNEKRLQALGDYLDLQLEAGRYKEVIPELARLKAEHPHRERFLAAWMLAVSAVGRRTEAMDAYHEYRLRNIEQRGLEPGQELHQAYLSVLREESFSVDNPDPVIPRQLPRRLHSLVARDRELATLSAHLADPAGVPVTVIHGAGGVGKTTLALCAAHTLADQFPDGQLYVDLHGFTPGRRALTAADALGGFLRALGLHGDRVPSDLDEASSVFRSATAGRRLLLVLDNARDRAQVTPLLPGSAGCAVIITSRKALQAIDGAHRVRLRPLSARNAVGLLAQEAGDQRVADEPGAAADIARLCGGMPLALRMAASRLQPGMSLHSLASSLTDASRRLDRLELPDTGVRASISASHHLLRDSTDPVDKLAERGFLLLSLLDGPDVSQAVAQALIREPGVLIDRAFDRLAEISLIDAPEPGRYRMHDLIRLYGREQLSRNSAESSALTRAFGVYVGTAWNAAVCIRPGDFRLKYASRWWNGAALTFPDSAAALDWSEAERENIMAAIRQSGSAPNVPAVIPAQLALAMFGFFRVRGYWNDAIEAADAGIAAARRACDRHAAACLHSDAGRVLTEQGKLRLASERIQHAIVCQRNIGDHEGLAQSLSNMGVVHFEGKRLDDALACYLDSLAIHRRLHDLRGQAMTLDNIGSIHWMKGRYDKALDCHNRALAIFRELRDSYGQAVALECTGELFLQTGGYREAATFLEQSLDIFRQMGDRHGEAESLLRLGSAQRSQQQYVAALRSHEDAVAISRSLGLSARRGLEREALREKALTLRARGHDIQATECLREAAGRQNGAHSP